MCMRNRKSESQEVNIEITKVLIKDIHEFKKGRKENNEVKPSKP